MSWMEQLVQTYDENASFAGLAEVEGAKGVLAPVGHIILNAQIEMTIDAEGNLIEASVVAKDHQPTLIPCTPDSASRTSSPSPHPLEDNLSYIARDYDRYAKKAPKKDKHPYTLYKKLLQTWAESPDSHPKACAIYRYISKHDAIHDLVNKKVLFLDESGKILEKWPYKDKEKPLIFQVSAGDLLKSLVRFRVVIPGDKVTDSWKDQSLQKSYQQFYRHCFAGQETLCYATGKVMISTDKHFKGIRYPGDGAKLISSNDKDGFTFRGRFGSGDECLSVGYETSQKSMNVLRWLIRNQGYVADGRVFLSWGRCRTQSPRVLLGTFGLMQKRWQAAVPRPTTMKSWADSFMQMMKGYRHEFKRSDNSQVNLIILDAATPGRLSICYYDEMAGEQFINRVERWHRCGQWRQHGFDKEQSNSFEYFGVPAPKKLVETCYGENISDKQTKMELERIFLCIVQGKPLPVDMIKRAQNHVVKRAIADDYYKWQRQLLEPACSIICNRLNQMEKKEGGYTVALDENNTERSYLYGRMLAVADHMERSTYEGEDRAKRLTNAMKYMEIFAVRPASTWMTIQQKLKPYQQKRERYGGKEKSLLAQIGSMFNDEDFVSDAALDAHFLLGYYCQQYAITQEIARKRQEKEEKKSVEEEIEK